MNELNALAMLPLKTSNKPIDAMPPADNESSADSSTDDSDSSLDAALEFAAALLGVTNGNSLPASGSNLPAEQFLDPAPNTLVQVAETPVAIDVSWPGPASGDLQLPEYLADAVMTPEAIAALAALSQAAQRGSAQIEPSGPTSPTEVLVNGELVAADAQNKARSLQEIRYANVPVTPDVPVVDPKSLPAASVGLSVASGIARTIADIGRSAVIARNGATENLNNMLPASIGVISAPLSTVATTAGSVPTLLVQSPLNAEGFGREFSEKVGWVINAKLPSAQIKLNPEHLGPVEMSVEVEEKQARVHFVALHGLTREAIEQSLPRLREALEQQGLSLQQADISDFSQRGDSQQERLDGVANEPQPEIAGSDDDAATEAPIVLVENSGLIDTFV